MAPPGYLAEAPLPLKAACISLLEVDLIEIGGMIYLGSGIMGILATETLLESG